MHPFDWETIIDKIPDILIATDRHGTIITVKGEDLHRLKVRRDMLIGRMIRDFLLPKNNGARTDACVRLPCEMKRPDGREMVLGIADHIVTPDGNEIWVCRDNVISEETEQFLDLYHDSMKKSLFQMIEDKNRSLEKLTQALVNALENANLFHDTETHNHIIRISEFSALLAQKMELPAEIVKKITLYSPLHDVGKVGIPDKILKKKDLYRKGEIEKMHEHVVIGARMLANPGIDPVVTNIVLYHHERWDGSGYVHGLRGKAIPIEARIVTIADTYDGLRTKRRYKKAVAHETAVDIMSKGSGSFFDPDILDCFLKTEDEFESISLRYS